jgi:hypothetical protein
VTYDGPTDGGLSDDDWGDTEPLSPEEEAAISALLASLPAEPMPPAVLARIEAALAAEPPLAAAARTVISLDTARARRRRLSPTLLRVAASIVVLAGAIALGVHAIGNTSGEAGSTAAGAAPDAATPSAALAASSPASGVNGQSGLRVTVSGRAYDAANLSSLAARLAGTSETVTGRGTKSPSPPTGTPIGGSAAPEASPTTAPVTTPSPGSAAPSDSGRQPLSRYSASQIATTPTLLAACVAQLTQGSGSTPLAVDAGTWLGKQALVVVLPSPDRTSHALAVYVVGTSCGQVADSTEIYEVTFLPESP